MQCLCKEKRHRGMGWLRYGCRRRFFGLAWLCGAEQRCIADHSQVKQLVSRGDGNKDGCRAKVASLGSWLAEGKGELLHVVFLSVHSGNPGAIALRD